MSTTQLAVAHLNLGSSGSRNLKIFFHIEEGCDFDLKVGRCGFMGLSNSFVVFEVQ
jgi:hypothetical protein